MWYIRLFLKSKHKKFQDFFLLAVTKKGHLSARMMGRTVQLLKADIRASLVTNQIWEFCYSYDYDDNSDDNKDVADADPDDNNFVFYFEVQTNYVIDLQTSFILRILFLHKLWHSHRDGSRLFQSHHNHQERNANQEQHQSRFHLILRR